MAVCTAIGAIVATDLRLLGKLRARTDRIAPPNEFVMRLVAGSLVVLYLSGAALIWVGCRDNPAYLDNPKLQAKLVLVGLLTLNAVVLHWHTFPWLSTARRVSSWGFVEGLWVAVPVAVSNSLWLYCAFLGIARPWNFVVPLHDVLAVAAVVLMLSLAGVLAALAFAAHGSRRRAARRAASSRRSRPAPDDLAGLNATLRAS